VRRLVTVLSLTGGLLLAGAPGASAQDLRDECYEHGGYRSSTVCFKIPPGVPSPIDLD
jgi:hypothetical protein